MSQYLHHVWCQSEKHAWDYYRNAIRLGWTCSQPWQAVDLGCRPTGKWAVTTNKP